MSWKTFLQAAPASDHAVQVYEDLAELCDSVGRYLDAGFHRGEPALLIATPDHLDAFVAEVEARGIAPSSRPRVSLPSSMPNVHWRAS
jgi:hypothetical protein